MFGVSLPQEGVTRQSTVVTQTNRKFRGLSAIYVIPFAVTRKVEVNDQPKAFIIKGLADAGTPIVVRFRAKASRCRSSSVR